MTELSTDPTDDNANAAAGGLTRITFNASSRSAAALTALVTATGDNRTDVINNALRLTATLHALAHPDGTVRVLAPDGTTCVVYLP